VRSYDPSPLKAAYVTVIKKAMEECVPGPFGGRPRFALVPATAAGLEAEGVGSEAVKVGTYGFIKGAPAFILGAIPKGDFANEDYGYCLEGVVLRAAELGLGTCWLGGALRRGQVAEILELGGEEMIPCISPIGMPSEKRSLVDRLVRSSAKGDNRKEPEELFFDGCFTTAFVDEGLWGQALEAVRLAPSASNKQPWRVLRATGAAAVASRSGAVVGAQVGGGEAEAPVFHFFMDEDRAYNSALGEAKMQDVDLGIAMRHFEVACKALGLPGTWKRLGTDPSQGLAGSGGKLRYIVSWL
jgi:nitroreductase